MSSDLPAGVEAFLATAGWNDAVIEPLAGDASFRRYFRIRRGERTAMLMDAPPPHEDPQPFLRAAKWLDANGLRAPHILAEDAARGLVLLEDFGDDRVLAELALFPAVSENPNLAFDIEAPGPTRLVLRDNSGNEFDAAIP